MTGEPPLVVVLPHSATWRLLTADSVDTARIPLAAPILGCDDGMNTIHPALTAVVVLAQAAVADLNVQDQAEMGGHVAAVRENWFPCCAGVLGHGWARLAVRGGQVPYPHAC